MMEASETKLKVDVCGWELRLGARKSN